MSDTAIRTLLETAHKTPERWTLQGFGMLRYYISQRMRLHVWSPRHAVRNVSAIHTHPWDFSSRIVSGSVVDTVYRCTTPGEVTHLRQKILCGEGGGLVGAPDTVNLDARTHAVRHYSTGETYRRQADEIHKSEPSAGAVTLCDRTFGYARDHACVYWPVGTAWVSAEPRPATVGEILDICRKALEVWKQ